MILLLLSLLGLGLGPLLDRTARRKLSIVAFLEGFVAATILGLVLGHILPEAVETGGWLCLPVAFAGLLAPQVAEGWARNNEFHIHGTVAVLALAALFLHTMLDGAALAGARHHPQESAAAALAVGVVLHRLPVGLTAWWLVRRSAGTPAAVLFLSAIGVGTLVGFWAGETAVAHLDNVSIALFEAFVSSSLVHVVLHRSLTENLAPHDARQVRRVGRFTWSGVGAVVGLIVLALVPLSGHSLEARVGVAAAFFDFFLMAAPYLLVGFLAVGLIRAACPPSERPAGRGCTLLACLSGLSSASARPALPASRTPGIALACRTAVPVLGLEILLFSVPLLGLPLAALRFVSAALLALALGLLLGPASGAVQPAENAAPAPAPFSISEVVRLGFGNAVDHNAPWLLVGFFAAALLETFLSPAWISSLPPGADLVGLALLGLVISFPAVAAIPIGLALLHKGVTPGAAIAFLTVGPIQASVTGERLRAAFAHPPIRRFSASVVAGALLVGLGLNRLPLARSVPALSGAPPTAWQTGCGLLLGLLLLLSLLRLGPGGMVARMGGGHHHHHHTHAH